jgi:pathogenesis-related protein 1
MPPRSLVVGLAACGLALALAACGGDDTPGGGGGDGGMNAADAPGGVGEPAELAGITLAHNEVRAAVDTSSLAAGPLPPMVWDPDLAAHAQAWADMCIDNDGNGLVDHSSSSYRQNAAGYAYIGENIFGSSVAMPTAQQAVTAWASEKANFTYPTGCSGVCGHYTQVVWRESVNLGCAIKTCNNLQFKGTILCEYGPGGNSGGAPY